MIVELFFIYSNNVMRLFLKEEKKNFLQFYPSTIHQTNVPYVMEHTSNRIQSNTWKATRGIFITWPPISGRPQSLSCS